MPIFWGSLGQGLAQGQDDYERGQERKREQALHAQQVKAALDMQQLQMQALQQQQQDRQRAAMINPFMGMAPSPPQPGQQSQPPQQSQGPQPPAPPPTTQPISPGSFGDTMTGVGNMPPPPGAPQGPMPPAPPASGAAAVSRTPQGVMPPYMALSGTTVQPRDGFGQIPPPTSPEEVVKGRFDQLIPSPMKLYQSAIEQLNKINPNDQAGNHRAAMEVVNEWSPHYKGQRADELAEVRMHAAASKAAADAYKAETDRLKAENTDARLRALVGVTADGQLTLAPGTKGALNAAQTAAAAARAVKASRTGGGGGGAASSPAPGSLEDQIAMARTGMSRQMIMPGWGANAAARWEKISSGAIMQIMNENPGMSRQQAAHEFARTQQVYRADGSALTQVTKDLTAIRPYNEMLDTNIGVAIDLAKKIVMSSSKLGNKSLNWLKQNVSDNPDTAEYLAQMVFVQTEAARVLNNPRLVGQLTVDARREMESVVSGDMPLNSAERVLNRIKADGKNRVAAMEKERQGVIKSGSGAPSGGAGKPSGGSGLPSGWSVEVVK